MDITLADVLTLGGAVGAAAIITGLIEVLKKPFKIIVARSWEQALALLFSLILVTAAFLDQGRYTLPDAFLAFVAWLTIAKLATGIYDEVTRAPSALIAPATAIGLALVLSLVLAAPVLARANASISGPDGARFGESAGVTFDDGKAKVDPFAWWALVTCFANGSTELGPQFDERGRRAVYSEYLHLGDQAGFPVNDDEMTFGPTSSWSGGGADCVVELIAYDGNGRFVGPYASDGFEVAP